jgi:hypothetical protein
VTSGTLCGCDSVAVAQPLLSELSCIQLMTWSSGSQDALFLFGLLVFTIGDGGNGIFRVVLLVAANSGMLPRGPSPNSIVGLTIALSSCGRGS